MSDAAQTSALIGPADVMNAFMAIGDSITIGFPGSSGGWRARLNTLAPKMVFQGRNNNTGLHEGYNGFRTDQVLPVVQPIIRILQPRCLLISMGVNDINTGQSPASTLTEVRAFAETLLAESSYITHVFVSTIAIGSTMNGLGGGAFNTGLAAEFAGADARIATVDTTSRLVIGSDFADGLHPNDAGYQKMAEDWFAALDAVFPVL
jgi:lysophospholipase L1-like esterase